MSKEEVTSVSSFELIENEDTKSIASFQSVREIEKEHNFAVKPVEHPATSEVKNEENEEKKALIEEKNVETVEQVEDKNEQETEPAQKSTEKQVQTVKSENTRIIVEEVAMTSQELLKPWSVIREDFRKGFSDLRESGRELCVTAEKKLTTYMTHDDRILYLFEFLFITSCIIFWLVQCQYAFYAIVFVFLCFIYLKLRKSVQKREERSVQAAQLRMNQ